MEALTSSCSKAIVVMGLGSYFHGSAALASDNRPQICLSSIQKKGCNLKLVQNKGIYPIHALESETWMDWDTEELEEVLETNEVKNIHVKFQLQKSCDYGEQFLIVGDDPMLGSWNPSNALPMAWSDDHIWTTHMNIPARKRIQFKFLLKGKTGEIIWQPGPDRILHTWETMDRITLCEDWENASSQKLIQEYQQANTYSSNEELNIIDSNSKVSQTHAKEKPLVKAEDNIDFSDEIIKNANNIITAQELIQLNEESANNLETDDSTVHTLKNQERI